MKEELLFVEHVSKKAPSGSVETRCQTLPTILQNIIVGTNLQNDESEMQSS